MVQRTQRDWLWRVWEEVGGCLKGVNDSQTSLTSSASSFGPLPSLEASPPLPELRAKTLQAGCTLTKRFPQAAAAANDLKRQSNLSSLFATTTHTTPPPPPPPHSLLLKRPRRNVANKTKPCRRTTELATKRDGTTRDIINRRGCIRNDDAGRG